MKTATKVPHKAGRFYVFMCLCCNREIEVCESDMTLVHEHKLDGVQCCGDYCFEDRIEVYNAAGERIAVIV